MTLFHYTNELFLQYGGLFIWAFSATGIKSLVTFTVKPVHNDHLRDPKFVAIDNRWSLFRGSFMR